MIERITILGGSSVYIPEFVQSVIHRNVNVKEIVLYGRKGRKLPVVADFCQRLFKRSGLPTTVTPSTKLEEAVKEATYIINHVRVGGMEARLRDETLPLKAGMIGDEALGAGGLACALRTLPVVFEFGRVLEKVNPGATIINLTNPQSVVVEALTRRTDLRVIGACNLPAAYAPKVAGLLRCPPDHIDIDYIGLNHMGWIQDIRVNGSSCMIQFLERLETSAQNGFDKGLVELFRMVPTLRAGIYFHQDKVLKNQKGCARFRAQVLQEAEGEILELYADKHLTEIPELTRRRNAEWYDGTITPLLQALEDKKEHGHIVCIRNDGAVRDLPNDGSIEIPAKVSSEGVRARHVGSCPRFLKGLYCMLKESDRLILEAVRRQSYETALQAFAINPFVPSVEGARHFLDMLTQEEPVDLH
ncbi:MAG: hypothetical protein ACLFU6_11885 [Candidatus Hydrogenedentota bacterium]